MWNKMLQILEGIQERSTKQVKKKKEEVLINTSSWEFYYSIYAC